MAFKQSMTMKLTQGYQILDSKGKLETMNF